MSIEGLKAKAEYIKQIESHIKHLTNGGRGSLESLSDAIVALLRVNAFQLSIDYMTADDCILAHSRRFNWPLAATIMTLILSIVGLMIKFL